MAAKVVKQAPAWLLPIKKWAYSKSYFPSLGLVIDDCIYEDKYVKEAIKRLPRQIREDRDFRISRALLLSNNKEVLPKDEWTKWEDDLPYLKDLVEEVKKEFKERKEWESK